MNYRAKLLLMIICFIIALHLSVQANPAPTGKDNDPQYVFYKANTLYEEGKYEEAISVYSRLIEQGIESGNLYYNIGNCYFKTSEIGKAILNYERARRLMPRDGDLEANYKYARSFIKGSEADGPVSWFVRISGGFGFFNVNGLTLFLSSVLAFSFVFLLSGLFVRPLRRWRRFVLPVVIVIFLLGMFSLYHRVSMIGKEAVVVAESTDAKYEPVDGATTYFTLYEGMRISVLETAREWSKIERIDGKTGWILRKDMEII